MTNSDTSAVTLSVCLVTNEYLELEYATPNTTGVSSYPPYVCMAGY